MAIARGRGAGSALTPPEATRVAKLIRPEVDRYVAKLDDRKYPPCVYEQLLESFRIPDRLAPDDLRQAILWKFGHFGKARIPSRHERLISELQRKWSTLVPALVGSSPQVFARLAKAAGSPYRYITVSFLLHLLRPNQIPIIDQHNFRAMNHDFKVVRPEWSPKVGPSAYGDLSILTAFVNDVRRAWRTVDPATLPAVLTFDRFLMMFGKGLKVRQSRIRPINALQRTGRAGR